MGQSDKISLERGLNLEANIQTKAAISMARASALIELCSSVYGRGEVRKTSLSYTH